MKTKKQAIFVNGFFGSPTSQPQTTGLFGTNTFGGFNTNASSTFGQTQPQTGSFGKPTTTFGKKNRRLI